MRHILRSLASSFFKHLTKLLCSNDVADNYGTWVALSEGPTHEPPHSCTNQIFKCLFLSLLGLFTQSADPTTFIHLSLEAEPISVSSAAAMTTKTGCVTPLHSLIPVWHCCLSFNLKGHMVWKSSATGQGREEQRWRHVHTSVAEPRSVRRRLHHTGFPSSSFVFIPFPSSFSKIPFPLMEVLTKYNTVNVNKCTNIMSSNLGPYRTKADLHQHPRARF